MMDPQPNYSNAPTQDDSKTHLIATASETREATHLTPEKTDALRQPRTLDRREKIRGLGLPGSRVFRKASASCCGA